MFLFPFFSFFSLKLVGVGRRLTATANRCGVVRETVERWTASAAAWERREESETAKGLTPVPKKLRERDTRYIAT